MSGFEVAGIVLGAFPLAITALDKYREVATRLGLFYKIRLEYKKCRDALEFHQLTFTRHLRQLLLPLVVDDDRIAVLLADPGGDSWRDQAVAGLLRKRLQDSFALYVGYIEGMESVMKRVNRELAADSDAVQERVNAPRAPAKESIRSALSKQTRTFQLYKLRFSNGEAVRRRLFAELQDYNDKLEKLLDSSDEDTRLVQQRTSAARSAAVDAAICRFWVRARAVFRALAAAWDCRCQQHGAKLLLQHRTSKKPEFHVTFTKLCSSTWEIRRARIAEGRDLVEAGTDDGVTILAHVPVRQPARPAKSSLRTRSSTTTTTTTTTTAYSVSFPSCPPSITLTGVPTTPHLSVTQPISNLCSALEQPEGSCCGYLSDDDCRYYVFSVNCQSAQTVPSVTLGQILEGSVLPRPTRTQRYNISLIVASSFLQLLDSPWMPASFDKTDIVFLGDPSDPNFFILDQPHINRDLAASRNDTPPGSTPQGPGFTDALDHLGILLLELCFGAVLEGQPCRRSWPEGGNERERAVFDVMAARNWQCHVNEEAGLDYAEAVGWCLGGNRSAVPERWRQDMLQKVIQPLQRCLDYLAGR